LRKLKDISWKRSPTELGGEVYNRQGIHSSLSMEGQIMDMTTRMLDRFLERDTGAGSGCPPPQSSNSGSSKINV